jgi:hypothetical protein
VTRLVIDASALLSGIVGYRLAPLLTGAEPLERADPRP